MAKAIETAVENIVLALLEGTDIELVDVEYIKEHDWYLRIYIDKIDGIGINDCQELSEKIGGKLDEENLIPDSYILEVSSPGLDRVLKKERDFVREKGKEVDVSFYEPYEGQKMITATLEGLNEAGLLLKDREPIELKKIAQVRLHIDI